MQDFVRVMFSRRLSNFHLLIKLLVEAGARHLHVASKHCTYVGHTAYKVNGGPITVAGVSTVPRPFDRPAPPQRLSLDLVAGQVPWLLELSRSCSGTPADIRQHQRLPQREAASALQG